MPLWVPFAYSLITAYLGSLGSSGYLVDSGLWGAQLETLRKTWALILRIGFDCVGNSSEIALAYDPATISGTEPRTLKHNDLKPKP